MLLKAKTDEKLEKILLCLQKLVHPPTDAGNEEESKDETNAVSHKESAEAKKAAFAKKKQMMMQKMKQKQHDLIEKKIEHAKDEKMDVDQTSQAEVSNQSLKITCAACQEVCDLQDYWKKPFVQMGYSSSSKLLYHSYRQTY